MVWYLHLWYVNECLYHAVVLMMHHWTLVFTSVQYLVSRWNCTWYTQMNACIMFDCFNDEILVCVNAGNQYLGLHWSCIFDIWLNALYYAWLFSWCICKGNAKPGCVLLRQSMAWRSSEHFSELFAAFAQDNPKLLWALKLTLYNTIAWKRYLTFPTLLFVFHYIYHSISSIPLTFLSHPSPPYPSFPCYHPLGG